MLIIYFNNHHKLDNLLLEFKTDPDIFFQKLSIIKKDVEYHYSKHLNTLNAHHGTIPLGSMAISFVE